MNQQFHKGDLVHVAKDLGPSMAHFTADIDAIVIGSYADQYGGSSAHCHSTYTLFLKGHGQSSWYDASQLTLLERDRLDLLEQWERDKEAEVKQASDLDWLFENCSDPTKIHGASVEALGRTLGMNNLWGSRGEGFVWMENAFAIMSVAAPFLIAKNKAGWLEFAAKVRTNQETRVSDSATGEQ